MKVIVVLATFVMVGHCLFHFPAKAGYLQEIVDAVEQSKRTVDKNSDSDYEYALYEIFRLYDSNNDGFITVVELAANSSLAKATKVVQLGDNNGDNKLSRDEVLAMLKMQSSF